MVAACSKTQEGSADANHAIIAKAWATMTAATLCMDMGFFDVILEGDSKQIVKELDGDSPNFSRYGHFADGIRSVLQSFRSSQVIFVKRDANSVAHRPTKKTVYRVIDYVCVKENFPFIYDIVTRELFDL